MQPQRSLLLFVLLLFATSCYAKNTFKRRRMPTPERKQIKKTATVPAFSWHQHNSSAIPLLWIDLSAEERFNHFARLDRHIPIHELVRSEQHQCLFLGKLQGELGRSSVAVTGCPGDELTGDKGTQVTIVSARHSGQYLWKRGKVTIIPSPWSSGSTSSATSIDRLKEIGGHDDFTCIEEDEMLDFKKEATLEHMEAFCAEGNCGDIPPSHKMSVRIGYDSSLYSKVNGKALEWIEEVMTHTQALLMHPSLPTEITLDILGVPTPYLDHSWKADSSITSLRSLTTVDPNTDLFVFFCDDPRYFGTVGIAYVGGLCDKNGFQVSLNEWRKTEASSGKVVAHEIGHNMGMSHDFSPKHAGRNCNGIMDYGDSEDAWSECSRDDFRAQYAVQLRTTGKHCMEILDKPDDNSGGSGFGVPPHTFPPTNASPIKPPISDCGKPDYVGDGYCDDENNRATCEYDGGDCCKNVATAWNHFCDQCECVDELAESWICADVKHQGDGYCDDENNNEKCGYDLGDCCNSNAKEWNFFCTECKCTNELRNSP